MKQRRIPTPISQILVPSGAWCFASRKAGKIVSWVKCLLMLQKGVSMSMSLCFCDEVLVQTLTNSLSLKPQCEAIMEFWPP